MLTTKNQNRRKRMNGANSIKDKRPCDYDESHITNVQQLWMLTVIMCNWHMPTDEKITQVLDLRWRKESKLPNKQEKIRLFFDSIGKLYNINYFSRFALNYIERTQFSFTISDTFCTVVL